MTNGPTVSIEEAKFVPRKLNGGDYTVMMPLFLAEHPSWDDWERERFASMKANLKRGDILFDVGAETGSISAIYARFVGAENIVLMEANPDNWQNIYATWQAEGLRDPLASFCGLVSSKTEAPAKLNYDPAYMGSWPISALTGRIWTPRSYRYIHEHSHNTEQTTLDDFAAMKHIEPNAITIDVEGAEYEVLLGASGLLSRLRPLVWVSVHPDLMLASYKHSMKDLLDMMERQNYEANWLANDHEIHYFFKPR